jgi:hypothetical protein
MSALPNDSPVGTDPAAGLYKRGREPFQPLAAVLAFVFPGAGHFFLGHTRRACCIAAGVLGLTASGLLIGGLDCIDRKDDPIWFYGQALVGPVTLGVDTIHQRLFKAYDPGVILARTVDDVLVRQIRRSPRPDEVRTNKTLDLRDAEGRPVRLTVPVFELGAPGQKPALSQSLGRMNELGTLFTAIAGMMNLICIVDAAWLHPRRRRTPA